MCGRHIREFDGVWLDIVSPGRPIVFYGSSRYFTERNAGGIGALNGTSLISSRAGACVPAVFQQGFWFTPPAEPEVSIVAADIGLPELSSIVICSSVPTSGLPPIE